MSLKTKTLGILLGVVVAYTAIQGMIHRSIIFPGFVVLEKQEADKNAVRLTEAMERELYHLSSLVSDWSSWDDTYEYMISGSRQYEEANLLPESTFEINHIDLLYICGPKGRVLWSKVVDPAVGEAVPWPGPGKEPFLDTHEFLLSLAEKRPIADTERTGIIKTTLGPMMIAARAVLTSDMEGPTRGFFVMGRVLTDEVIQAMVRQIGVSFTLLPADAASVPGIPAISDLIEGNRDLVIDGGDPRTLYLYTVLNDISRKPVYLVKAATDRNILEQGRSTLTYSMMSIVFSCVVLIFPTLLLLHLAILRPVSMLADHVRDVEESGDLSKRLDLDRDDEFGMLAQRFDDMLVRLAELRSELLERSYYSGLAGITSDILHHGRNIMMPMSQGMGVMKNMCRTMPKESIRTALDEINEGVADPERLKNLERFLFLAVDEMLKAFNDAEGMLEKIALQTQEMESLFNDLEKHCRSVSPVCQIQPRAMVRDALEKIPHHLKAACPIRLTPHVDQAPAMNADPLILVQVLNALLYRALIMSIRGSDEPCVTVDVGIDVRNQRTLIRLSITAKGARENDQALKNMFARTAEDHFTSKSCSSLHWCSNVVTAMKGDLDFERTEDGMAFHLILPLGREG